MKRSVFALVLVMMSTAHPSFALEPDYCSKGAQALSREYHGIYHDVMECTGLYALSPRIVFVEQARCSRSFHCCIKNKTVPCLDDRKQTCGVRGLYVHRCTLIVLPHQCESALRHEFIHHLLHTHKRNKESANHQAPEFKKCERDSKEPMGWGGLFNIY